MPNSKKIQQLLQKSLQRGGEGGLENPLPLGYLLKRVHLFSIGCKHMDRINALCRFAKNGTCSNEHIVQALRKINYEYIEEMEKFNKTIDYENLENNQI